MITSFFKRIRMSVKSVFFNYKRYLCFFVMLLIIETLFSSVITLFVNNNRNQKELLEESYNYHLQLQDLSQTQYYTVINIKQPENQEYFEITEGHKYQISGTNRWRYDVNIRFYENVASNYRRFSESYYEQIREDGEFSEFCTPLLNFNIALAGNTAICVLTCIFIFFCGCVIVYLLDSIMVNHYKFIYGVNMTFGANFKKLFEGSITEMVLISAIVFIPSQIISGLACLIILATGGLSFVPSFTAMILSLIIGILIAAVAVFINIKRVSRSTPLKLISAVDNSNLIRSPRQSSYFIGYEFPKSTELLSLKRYVKYLVPLLAGTVMFSVFFEGSIFLGNVYKKTLTHTEPQFTIIFSGERKYYEDEETNKVSETTEYEYTYTDEIRDYLMTFPGIDRIYKECSASAVEVNANVKIPKDKVKSTTMGIDIEGEERVFLNADFHASDRDVLSYLESSGYEIEGDIYSVINNENTIAITDGFKNSSKFKLKPGDKISISTKYEKFAVKAADNSNDFDLLLANYLNAFNYTYTEFTVGAVIKGMPVGNSFGIYIGTKDYYKVTKRAPIFDRIDIYTKEDITAAEKTELTKLLRGAGDYYSNMIFVNNDSDIKSDVQKSKNYESVYVFIALMLLVVSPLLWFFSQILFYLKRRPEFDVYFSLGAQNSEIKKLFYTDAAALSVLFTAAYTVLSVITAAVLTKFVNSPLYPGSSYMRFGFEFPFLGFFGGLILNLLCAFLSTYISYKRYIKACHPVFSGIEKQGKNDLISEGETGI